ncbi:hypothetical protein FNV43_RR02395 [Rhamnella rubrinervis]|uniref:Uncharacterized protein n=1 Tax=Rhamnella rubrinervis TaxID=2594499 RepID=A0A8K0HRJ7_9ROSA|nr:hypothetical protein FNV43_RR02395 [Rhamnella rubrinervis]
MSLLAPLEDYNFGLFSYKHTSSRIQHECTLESWGSGEIGAFRTGVEYYLQYTLVMVVLSGVLVLGMYHILIQKFKLEYFRRVTAVGYSSSFLGHLSGIIVGYAIAWGLIHGMNNFWAVSMLGWIAVVFVFSLKRSGAYDFNFLEIESVTDPSLPSVRFLGSGNGRTLQMSSLPVAGTELV